MTADDATTPPLAPRPAGVPADGPIAAPAPAERGADGGAACPTPVPLAYEDVPQQAARETAADAVRWTLPVTPAVRRSYALAKAWPLWNGLVALTAVESVAVVGQAWLFGPTPLVGWSLAGRLAVGPLSAVGLGLALFAASWAASLRLRPRLLEMTEDGFAVTERGGRPATFDRARIFEVVVRRLPLCRCGTLVVTAPLYPLAEVWYAPVADLEVVAAELRAALWPTSAAHQAADGIGGRAPAAAAPSMPSAALWGRP